MLCAAPGALAQTEPGLPGLRYLFSAAWLPGRHPHPGDLELEISFCHLSCVF